MFGESVLLKCWGLPANFIACYGLLYGTLWIEYLAAVNHKIPYGTWNDNSQVQRVLQTCLIAMVVRTESTSMEYVLI